MENPQTPENEGDEFRALDSLDILAAFLNQKIRRGGFNG
jgi:hypothetical protein